MAQREHINVVFSTIFPANLEAFRHAQQILTRDHFGSDKIAALLWKFLGIYSDKYGGVASPAWIKERFKGKVSRSDYIVLEDMVDRYTTNDPSSLSAFKASVDDLHDEYIKTRTGQALVDALEITEHGKTVDGEEVIGHEAAREYISTALREIEAEYHVGDVAEGDVASDNDFLEEYYEVKSTRLEGGGGGIGFGIRSLDDHVGGVMPGDLVLIAGYTSSGKTQLLCQMAWHAAVNQKKNVFFSTTETVRRQVHSRIISRHSRLEKFGVPGGLNSKHILKGMLSEHHEKVFADVVEDMRKGDYGSILISQTPSDATLDYVEGRLIAWEQHTRRKCDLLLIDSVYLLSAPRKRGSEREEFNDLLRDSKRRATSLGIPIVTPWQIRREAWEKAVEGSGSAGFGYGLSAMSDTSEAEKSASVLIPLLKDPGEDNVVYAQVLKNRDGELLDSTVLHVDYRNAYLADSADVDYSGGDIGSDVRGSLMGAF